MMSHGIPKLILPINQEGVVEIQQYRKWLSEHEMESEPHPAVARATIPIIDAAIRPSTKDVLTGRGSMIDGHWGNRMFKKIIAWQSERYQNASRFEKTDICIAVFLRMKESGTRFLKKDSDGDWIEADDTVAKKKISHSFRNYNTRGPNATSRPYTPTCTTCTTIDSSLRLEDPSVHR
jgi:hypothetical protein